MFTTLPVWDPCFKTLLTLHKVMTWLCTCVWRHCWKAFPIRDPVIQGQHLGTTVDTKQHFQLRGHCYIHCLTSEDRRTSARKRLCHKIDLGALFCLSWSKCNIEGFCTVEEMSISKLICLVAGASGGFNHLIRERCKNTEVHISAGNNHEHSIDIFGNRYTHKNMKIYLKAT